jgi:hypothetical protein
VGVFSVQLARGGTVCARSVSGERGENVEYLLVGGNLPLLCANGVESDDAVAVDDEERGTLPEAHCAAGDVVGVEDRVVRVGEDRVRHWMLADVSLDRCGGFRRDRDDGGIGVSELGVVVAQLREMPTAEWSRESSQEHQHHGSARDEVIERDRLSLRVGKRESRCRDSN